MSASPSECLIDVLTRAVTTIMINGRIDPGISTRILIEFGRGVDGTVIFDSSTVSTSNAGEFSTSFTPPSSGNYKIEASFLGDDRYGASSTETSVTVKDDYITLIKLIIALAIIVTIIILAVCFLRNKRMNMHSK